MTNAAAALALKPSERFDIASVIGNVISVIRRNFPVFVLISALTVMVPSLIAGTLNFKLYSAIGSPSLLNNLSPNSFSSQFPITLFEWLLGAVGLLYLQASVSAIVISQTEGTTAPNIISDLWRHLLPLLGILVLTGIAGVVGLVLLFVPGIIVLLAFSVAAPVRMREGLGVFDSLRRSWALTRGFRWRMFLVFLLLYIMTALAEGILFMLRGVFHSSFAVWAVSVGPVLAGAVNLLFVTTGAVVYCELRKAKEGASASEVAAAFS